jgi:citrate lyase subunit beta/citryl-CoA lyase
VDAVFPALDDETGLRRGAHAARALGFVGKSIIHPRQLGPVHEVFTPSEAELQRARQVIAADGQGAVALDGQFVDPAIVARARATLALAGEVSP